MASRVAFSDQNLANIAAVLPQFSLREQALWILGIRTGYRPSELGALRISDIWAGGAVKGSVTLERRSLKNGRGCHRGSVRSRTLPLTPAARDMLGRYLLDRFESRPVAPEEPLFRSKKGRGLSRWQINRVIHEIAQAAGCAREDRAGGHSLRKTFCQGIYRTTGHDINLTRTVMGHASVVTTMRYLEISEESAVAAVLALDQPRAA